MVIEYAFLISIELFLTFTVILLVKNRNSELKTNRSQRLIERRIIERRVAERRSTYQLFIRSEMRRKDERRNHNRRKENRRILKLVIKNS